MTESKSTTTPTYASRMDIIIRETNTYTALRYFPFGYKHCKNQLNTSLKKSTTKLEYRT